MEINRNYLINFIKNAIPIADNVAAQIAFNFEPVHYKKDDFILKSGQVCNDYLFLETGFVRAYTFNTEGAEVTTNFYGSHSIVFEVASYFKRTPSVENIQALTDSTGWKGDYQNFQVLFHTVPQFREFGRAILVNGFIALKERTLAMITTTAEQRYQHLLAARGDVMQYAPLKHIASYLGITDSSLSRIRKELAQK